MECLFLCYVLGSFCGGRWTKHTTTGTTWLCLERVGRKQAFLQGSGTWQQAETEQLDKWTVAWETYLSTYLSILLFSHLSIYSLISHQTISFPPIDLVIHSFIYPSFFHLSSHLSTHHLHIHLSTHLFIFQADHHLSPILIQETPLITWLWLGPLHTFIKLADIISAFFYPWSPTPVEENPRLLPQSPKTLPNPFAKLASSLTNPVHGPFNHNKDS